jgi:hypothetical protein
MAIMQDKVAIRGKPIVKVFEHSPEGIEAWKRLLASRESLSAQEYDRKVDAIMNDPALTHIKRRPQTWWQRIFGLPGDPAISEWHNIMTDQGDAIIADIMSQTPARQKPDNTHCWTICGTAYSGTTPKARIWVVTPTGSSQLQDATYPKQKGAFGAANDNVTQYRVTFAPGAFGTVTINEALMATGSTSGAGDSLTYGAVSPSASVTALDSLQIQWEITYLGA